MWRSSSKLRSIAREANLAIDAVGKVIESDFETPDLLFLALADTRAANDLAIARDRARRLASPVDRLGHVAFLRRHDAGAAVRRPQPPQMRCSSPDNRRIRTVEVEFAVLGSLTVFDVAGRGL